MHELDPYNHPNKSVLDELAAVNWDLTTTPDEDDRTQETELQEPTKEIILPPNCLGMQVWFVAYEYHNDGMMLPDPSSYKRVESLEGQF